MTYEEAARIMMSDGGGGGGSTIIPKRIIENGVYNASDDNADGYGIVTVDIPADTQTLHVTANGIYKASDYGVAGFDEVYVNVPDTAFKLNIDKEDLDLVPDIEGDYELVDKDSNCSLRFERVDNPMADPSAFSTGFFAVYTNLDTGVTIPVNIFGVNYRTTADANIFFRIVSVDTSTSTPTFTLELKHSDGRIIKNITWQPNAAIVGGRMDGTNWKISPVVNSD